MLVKGANVTARSGPTLPTWAMQQSRQLSGLHRCAVSGHSDRQQCRRFADAELAR